MGGEAQNARANGPDPDPTPKPRRRRKIKGADDLGPTTELT